MTSGPERPNVTDSPVPNTYAPVRRAPRIEKPGTVRFDELDLGAVDGGRSRGALAGFPFSPDRPGRTTAAATEFTVVYNQAESGHRIGAHTDAAEELLFMIVGIVEATVGKETILVSVGSLTVIPADTEHRVRNTGTETAELVGLFGSAPVESTFGAELVVVTTEPNDD
jgi:quercetin dioxygenase-like cupin family protein